MSPYATPIWGILQERDAQGQTDLEEKTHNKFREPLI